MKMGTEMIGWGGMDWIDLAQDKDQWWAHVNTIMNLRVILNAGKSWSSCTTGGLSRRPQLLGVTAVHSGDTSILPEIKIY
jgi:hypothetical protein